MDSISQAVLGAAVQGALLGKVQGRRALLYGAALGTLPDLDVFVRYADPVSSMTYHRGFSHSVFVLTALAALMTRLVRRRWPDAPYSTRRFFTAVWLVLITHVLLDAFTVYGTQMFWPLAPTPESWAAIFIIDPVYTVPLLLAVLSALAIGLAGKGIGVLAGALVFSTAYLGFGLSGRLLVEQRVSDALKAQGVAVERLRAVPMPLNTLVWRVIAQGPGGQQIEAVSSLFDRKAPEWVRLPPQSDVEHVLKGVPLYERLRWFTGDWLRLDVIGDALVVSDLRMGIAGQYTFRFQMAQCDASTGRWQVVTPSAWPSVRPGMEELKVILARITHQQPPLPLAQWVATYLETGAGSQPAISCR